MVDLPHRPIGRRLDALEHTRADATQQGGGAEGNGKARSRRERPQRPVRSTDLKSLHSMGLDETATPDQVKAQYKTLVKRLHPDANGGSRANEDKLREIIQAYGRLRETGFC